MLGLELPDGREVVYARDAVGNPTSVHLGTGANASPLVTDIEYAPFGPSTGWTYGNGRRLVRRLDADYRPLSITDSRADGLNLAFGLDPAGQIVALNAGTTGSKVAGYAYDGLGRVIRSEAGDGSPLQLYQLDGTGNRLSHADSSGTVAYHYPPGNHRLLEVGTQSRTYDANGNMLTMGSRSFVYGTTNRMEAVLQNGVVQERYVYNDLGERILREPVGGAAVHALYDEAGRWLGDYRSDGVAIKQAVWLDDFPVAVLSPPSAGVPAIAYVQPDHLGTPRVVIDSERDVAIWQWPLEQDPFGAHSPDQDADGDGVVFDFKLRFPGQQYTEATGLNYNYNRDLDASTGRYVQSDPIGLMGGISTYGYVDGDPLSAVDPSGLRGVRSGGGNSAQRRTSRRAQEHAIQSNTHRTPIYTRGLSPEHIGSLENAASLLGDFDYTQLCAVHICRNAANQCTGEDVRTGGFPFNPTVAAVHAQGCMCVQPYYAGDRRYPADPAPTGPTAIDLAKDVSGLLSKLLGRGYR